MCKLNETDAGCWLDSSRGWQNMGEAIIEFAVSHGWKCPTQNEEDIGDTEIFNFDVDEAETYLNTLAPEGFYFGSENGDWGLWKNEEGD